MDVPATPHDATHESDSGRSTDATVEIIEGRSAEVGGFAVRRLLPRRARRTVGAWCFVDHMGPGRTTTERGLDVGPHPHIGLQTVTWLLRGAVLHRDSLGSEQMIRPGQLNLMTAGHGVAHSEETSGVYNGELHGVQLWVAQPEATRAGPAAFEHHQDLPQVELEQGVATVIVGALAGVSSAARRDSEHVGVDLDLRPGQSSLALVPSHEYAIAVLEGELSLAGQRVAPGGLAYLGQGRDELLMRTQEGARAMLIGGAPIDDELVMWWNYVGRSRQEIRAAHRSWVTDDGRFGTVRSPLARVVIGDPPWGE